MRDPNSGTTMFSFNGFGELRQKVDALKHVTEYETDVLGRVSRITVVRIGGRERMRKLDELLSRVE